MDLSNLLFTVVALALCISIHETAHAWTAYKLGDPTAKLEGRISLNPLRHLDPLGTLMIFVAHFGWGKPTPYNPRNLSHPRRDAALIAAAGPLSNLVTAFLIALLFRFVALASPWHDLLQAIYELSVVLFLFNLLPIAPLDGSKFIGAFIPASWADRYERFLRQGPVLLILLIVADRLLDSVIHVSLLGTYLEYGYEWITIGFMLII